MRESDWAALADVQFILYNRIANQLNEALTGIALSDMAEAADKPPGYWKERAVDKITNVLNMFTAWTWLIRYKSGEPIPKRAIRPFETNALLAWLGRQLQLNPPPVTKMNPLLHGNQETLQEALLLLYSVAYTQGASVRLAFEATKLGTWFRVRFDRHKQIEANIDAMLASFGDHWRERDTVFELSTARDFVRLNGCALALNATDIGGEFAFFVRAVGAEKRETSLATAGAPRITTAQSKAAADGKAVAGQELTEPATDKGATTEKTFATPVMRRYGQTKPLDPDAVARYLDQRGAAEHDSGTTPVVETPAIKPTPDPAAQMPAPQPVPEGAPPTLAMLRPFPPRLRGDATRPPTLDGREHPREPAAASGPADDSTQENPPGTSRSLTGALRRLPSESTAKTNPKQNDTIILRADIPAPQLPDHLRKPPAATSNVALTRETQTITPVSPKADKPHIMHAATESNESQDSAARRSQDHASASKEDNNS
jgi:hypothetical protein